MQPRTFEKAFCAPMGQRRFSLLFTCHCAPRRFIIKRRFHFGTVLARSCHEPLRSRGRLWRHPETPGLAIAAELIEVDCGANERRGVVQRKTARDQRDGTRGRVGASMLCCVPNLSRGGSYAWPVQLSPRRLAPGRGGASGRSGGFCGSALLGGAAL